MITDLEKYGLVALAIIVVTILFITIQEMNEDNDVGLNGIYFDDSLDGLVEEEIPENMVVILDDPPLEPLPPPQVVEDDFDFTEDPVSYPGKPAPRLDERPAAIGSTLIHKVRKGETLSAISKEYYGSTKWWKTIADANPDLNPRRLAIGDKVRIPILDQTGAVPVKPGGPASVAMASTATERTASATEYRVKPGDTLGKIASRFYGNAGKWRGIFNANKSKIGDPKKLPVGIMLTIP